jgi:hypothetical protein
MRTNLLTGTFILCAAATTLLSAGNRDAVRVESGFAPTAPTSLVIGLTHERVELPLVRPDLAPATQADLPQCGDGTAGVYRCLNGNVGFGAKTRRADEANPQRGR